MFSYIHGTVAEITTDQLVLETGGIGYLVFFPANAVADLPKVGELYKAYIHYAVKEDGVYLYGFPSKAERELFELLISISGIGPKGAMTIIGSSRIEHMLSCIAAGETSGLVAIPGIGKKTAERIVLELREKIRKLGMANAGQIQGLGAISSYDEALNALAALGFSANRARQALSLLPVEELELPVEEVIRKALAVLDEQRR